MRRMVYVHDAEYDKYYPKGVPASVSITTTCQDELQSSMHYCPPGHCSKIDVTERLLDHKFRLLGRIALAEEKVEETIEKFSTLETATAKDVQSLYAIEGLLKRERLV